MRGKATVISAHRHQCVWIALVVLLGATPTMAQVEYLPPVTPLFDRPLTEATPNSEALPALGGRGTSEPDPASLFGDPPAMKSDESWEFQVLPNTLIWHSYMAGTREPGFRSVWSEVDGMRVWDVTLGARVGLWRYGTNDKGGERPDGWQLDMDGAVMPRLFPETESTMLVASDYRFGLTQTYGNGPFQAKAGYAHLSSHIGDEYLLANPSFQRLNYVRDSVLIALGYYVDDDVRIYGEIAYALGAEDGAKPLELQYGIEYSPIPVGRAIGAPFAAINCDLREELGLDGDLVVQAGWQWRRTASGHRFRVGAQYYDGYSEQGEFFDVRERKLGFGIWYDF